MKVILRVDASIGVELEREIIFHGITKFVVLPSENDQIDFVFYALTQQQRNVIHQLLKSHSYLMTFAK
ncbi:hypothetical protein LOK74_14650 [Brevibacillus humidisoli]|uniref:hypothetical protein n=1 Tax=Brevibacillus humidisoli TaxID=2895522 RepID=UPI001E45C22A|nr:hypothetical protein [Brevibacillus humidisoli]UFJ39308.1 hypothetical protein LOK74_14650 [Brevibacillus humidisoli]